jgi:ADP-ribose pyrophosphatase YjhB (NUDIX family)
MALLNQDFLFQTADELRAVATLGLMYAENEYDLARYRQVLETALRLYAALDGRPFEEVQQEYTLDNWRHVSPAAGAEALVVRGGQLLLIRRSDNGLWAVPGGLVEVGESLALAAQRELLEETGVRARIVRLLGIFDSRIWHSRTRAHLYHAIFLAEAADPSPVTSSEASEVGFFDEQHLPPLSPGHDLRVPLLFKLLRGELPVPYFDVPALQ